MGKTDSVRRSFVKVDRFALMQVRREFLLTPVEYCLLVTLLLLVDWRSSHHGWTGTIVEMTEECPGSRKTLATALTRLEKLHIVRIVETFRGGHVRGTVAVPAYLDVFVCPERSQQADHPSQRPKNGGEIRKRIEDAYAAFGPTTGADADLKGCPSDPIEIPSCAPHASFNAQKHLSLGSFNPSEAEGQSGNEVGGTQGSATLATVVGADEQDDSWNPGPLPWDEP